MLNRLLWSFGSNERVHGISNKQEWGNLTDGSVALETGVIGQTNKIQCWHGYENKT